MCNRTGAGLQKANNKPNITSAHGKKTTCTLNLISPLQRKRKLCVANDTLHNVNELLCLLLCFSRACLSLCVSSSVTVDEVLLHVAEMIVSAFQEFHEEVRA